MQGLDLQRRVTRDFALEVMYQGSGYLDLGAGGDYNGYVSWTSGEALDTAIYRRTNCAETRTGSCAIELKTGATSKIEEDRKAMGLAIWGENPYGDYGTAVYIENLGSQITVNDIGGDVGKLKREQIDVYTGLRGGMSDQNFVDPPDSRVWRLERVE
jgi:3D (Asp-Asp-Asp) domain-containing protein